MSIGRARALPHSRGFPKGGFSEKMSNIGGGGPCLLPGLRCDPRSAPGSTPWQRERHDAEERRQHHSCEEGSGVARQYLLGGLVQPNPLDAVWLVRVAGYVRPVKLHQLMGFFMSIRAARPAYRPVMMLVRARLPATGEPMTYTHLEIERSGHVWTCALSNPPHHTLNAVGVAELVRMLDEVESDPSVRVLVLTGAGEGVFVAHYEVNELADAAEQQGAGPADSAPGDDSGLHTFHQLVLRLERLHAVTIAALNGSAAGGGCELSLGCDFRLMADGPFGYGLPETLVGIIPGGGGTQRFARLLGTARALDLILHGRILSPVEALEIGLVHRVFPADAFRDQVEAFAADLAGRAPLALAAAKRAIHEGSRLPLEQGLAVEQACFERIMRSKDAAGAMRAFLAGQGYQWQGE